MRCVCRLCLAIALVVSFNCVAQDVTSRTSGFWDDPETWEGGSVPTALTAGQITILTNHDVVVRDVQLIDQLVVNAGSSLTVSETGVLQLRDGPADDLIIIGRVEVNGTLDGGNGSTISSDAASLVFHEGASYIHSYTTSEGSLPLASWNSQSVVRIAGYTSATSASAAGNWGQDFGTVVWDTPNLQLSFDLAGQFDHIQGNLIIQSTNAQRLLLSSVGDTDQLIVDGNFELLGSSSFELTNSLSGHFTLATGKNFIVNTSGVMSIANQGVGVVQTGGDISITNGTISESGSGTGQFRFSNSTRHQFDRGVDGLGGVFNGRIDYFVSVGDTLDLMNAVLSAGIGTNNANTLSVSGTLMVGSTDPAGAIQNNTTSGNIRTTVSLRSFLPGSRVIYSGAQPQFLGNAGVAAGADTETVINNVEGVSLAANVVIEGPLVLHVGTLQIGDGRTLTLAGDVVRTDGEIDATPTSTLVISDSISNNRILDLSPDQLTLGTFTVDRRVEGATLTLSSEVLTTQLNLMSGTVINEDRISLLDGGMISRWPRAFLTGQEVSVPVNGQYNVTYRTGSVSNGSVAKLYSGLELPSSTSKLRNLIISTGQSLDSVVLTKDITINSLLDMNRGRLYVQNHTIDFKGTIWSDDTGNFGPGNGLVIFSDSTSVQGSSNPVFHSIRVLAGSYVRFARNMSVSGDIDFLPTSIVDASAITITLTGATSQHLNTNGVRIGNITVSKSNQAFVQLESALPLRGVLRFNTPSANIDFRSNGFLTLISEIDTATTSFGNSMIYRLQNGNTVSGNVTVQRFLSGEGRIYRYLSTPVNNSTVAAWKDDFSITGNFLDPSPAENICGSMTNRNSSSLYYYDEVKGATSPSGYVAYPAPSTSSVAAALEAGRGYSAFIRQCADPTVIDVSGPINQQLLSLPVTFTDGSALSGWNLVGNPYPCTIDWDITGTQGWIKTNIASSIAIRDNGGGGFYRYWDGDGDPSDFTEGRIAPGQGFWVRTIAPNPVLAVREGVKVLQTATYYRDRDTTSVFIVSLHHGNQVDKTYLKIKQGASNEFDSLDCPKLDNVAFDLATYSLDHVALAINALENVGCRGEIPLICKDLEAGQYRFEALAKGVFGDYVFTLRDNEKGVETEFSESYSFGITSPISFNDTRFTLRWEQRALQPVELISANYILCDSESTEISVVNQQDDVSYELWEGNVRVGEGLKINSTALTAGMHKLVIYAVGQCDRKAVSDTVFVARYSPVLRSWRSGEVCNDGSVHLFGQAEEGAAVVWYSSEDSELVLARDTIFITPTIRESTTFYVAAALGGCESKRQSVMARVISFNPVSLVQSGNILISSMQQGNTWFLNGQQLYDEPGFMLYPSGAGIYSVRNRVESCVTEAFLELREVVPLALLYPNPIESTFTIEADFNNIVRVELLNTLGQSVAEIDPEALVREKIGIFDATKLKAGLYFLRLLAVGRKEEILMVVKK